MFSSPSPADRFELSVIQRRELNLPSKVLLHMKKKGTIKSIAHVASSPPLKGPGDEAITHGTSIYNC